MEKEPITLNGLNKIKEELIFLKEKKKTRNCCSDCRS
jgi:transcription elongation factor GreA